MDGNEVIGRAFEMFLSDNFRWTVAHPQGWEYAIAHGLYRGTYAQWVWENAYSEARLERAMKEGKAEATVCGLVYTG